MSAELAVRVNALSKHYERYRRPIDRVLQIMLRGRRQLFTDFWALRDVSFELPKGESIGVIGRNGAGKSTLLQLLVGTLVPTTGTVEVNGRIGAVLQLGTGFSPQFSGRENVYLSGAVLRLSRKEIDARMDEIEEFAGIGDFIDQPVITYSSGMYVRLAFAVQACIDPDVLIVDEALSVGDIFFQQKCHARMEDLVQRGTTVIIVSHDMRSLEKYCSRVLVLDAGRPVFLGEPTEALARYTAPACAAPAVEADPGELEESSQDAAGSTTGEAIKDWPADHAFVDLTGASVVGEDVVRLRQLAVCDAAGQPSASFEIGETVVFFAEFEFVEDTTVPIWSFELVNASNLVIHSKSSLQHSVDVPGRVAAGSVLRVRQSMNLWMAPGEYTVTVGFATMPAAAYSNRERLSAANLWGKLEALLHVVGTLGLLVRDRSTGISVPFYGYADLPGSASMCVVEGEPRTEQEPRRDRSLSSPG